MLDNLWNALSNECPMTHKVPTLSILWTQIQTSREQNKKLKVENNQKYSENLPPKTNKYSKFQVSTNIVWFFHFKRIHNPDFDIVKFIWRFDWGEGLDQLFQIFNSFNSNFSTFFSNSRTSTPNSKPNVISCTYHTFPNARDYMCTKFSNRLKQRYVWS